MRYRITSDKTIRADVDKPGRSHEHPLCTREYGRHVCWRFPRVESPGRRIRPCLVLGTGDYLMIARPATQHRIYLSPPHLCGREQAFVQEAFDTNWIAPLGPHVDAFEREFCAAIGAP